MKIRLAIKQLVQESYGTHAERYNTSVLDCALGRNSFGTSRKVIECGNKYDWSKLYQHPDTRYYHLKQEICRFWSNYANIKTTNVKVANGSNVILSRINKLFIESGTKVLGYVPQFTRYMVEVAILGGVYEAVPLDRRDYFKFNEKKFLGSLTKLHSIVYIDNPNNPTGQLISLTQIEAIVKNAQKKNVAVIIDEAYGDYVEEKYSAINMVREYENLIVTRTFTKGYGIGQFRVGYAIMPDALSEFFNKIELPFSISEMGASLAKEALLDQTFILN